MDSSPNKSSNFFYLAYNSIYFTVRDHEINPELTEKYRKDPNFQKYIEWGKANGVKMSKVNKKVKV